MRQNTFAAADPTAGAYSAPQIPSFGGKDGGKGKEGRGGREWNGREKRGGEVRRGEGMGRGGKGQTPQTKILATAWSISLHPIQLTQSIPGCTVTKTPTHLTFNVCKHHATSHWLQTFFGTLRRLLVPKFFLKYFTV